ncbi:HAMP domain-containing histidine kinase [Ktedonosporobacter rubrisoli]|uniref:histidine kinase n=1 Tax=Ktedonosporobacter rubrisoli TaxID=2509675 RepID=A0A4P6JQI2_KTERU|nr:HAMP domain-containing sensor histidine kinase [Ktedonosporobacter rubrisoli]QBD77430.1 HAMP domain-containing histidine kinase [Ktedonosporobacter rubrisoli]
MRTSIVFKWFVLIAFVFSTLLLFIGVAQNYLFEKYYIDEKSNALKTYMKEYMTTAAKEGSEAASYDFYRKNNVWITKLDKYGCIKDVGNFYLELKLTNGSQDTIRIPLYSFKGNIWDFSALKVGEKVLVDTVNIADESIPYLIQGDEPGISVTNPDIAFKVNGPHADPAYRHLATGLLAGTITKTAFPDRTENIPFPYNDSFFLEQVKQFQVGLLADNAKPPQYTKELSTKENLANYKIIIEPVVENGVVEYVFAMTALQPVDEAISVTWQFYPYFLGFAVLCVMLLAFIFSRHLAKPLISINRITGKIAKMDFTEKLPVRSKDEIGELSRNINYLSSQMETYIGQLKQELDNEKRLETTRKEFIAGVSHELKTPLAVLKSCLSILKDGIASEKRDHYFQAIEDEIQRMDALVVNMLDLAKFASGTYKPEIAPFEIDLAIEEVCASLAGQIKEKNVTLTQRFSPYMVIGHRGLIIRVMTNFLTNAIRHTENGHTISIEVQRKGDTAEISVENQGSPIAEEDRKKIWDQFYIVESRTSKSSTGLGLSISKAILELHHADYGVENTEDGVSFFFALPLQP